MAPPLQPDRDPRPSPLEPPEHRSTSSANPAHFRRTLPIDIPTRAFISHNLAAGCKVAPGYRPLVFDVYTLVGVFRSHWSSLQGKVPVTDEELLYAKARAVDLQRQLGLKEQAPAATGDAALLRQKAFTLFMRTYEEGTAARARRSWGRGRDCTFLLRASCRQAAHAGE